MYVKKTHTWFQTTQPFVKSFVSLNLKAKGSEKKSISNKNIRQLNFQKNKISLNITKFNNINYLVIKDENKW